ncbi:MAG: DNA topoisomerase IV subunit A [Spirochaetaceae bacterium]|nr:MAG: DNA topoisomerase IV subunit A [Spirochaetaceae bacterium]
MAYVNTLFNENFLEYASYVIKDRAIPHLDDGLKPVQRRILHSLLEMDDGKFHKVANIVGHTMQYHPHGDASIYSALVVLANKELFIDKQGNFGNILTGDEASAARYIECRATPLAKRMLHKPDITDYEPSYDGRRKEPVTFPAKFPVVLVLGAEGIAVGMSTKILPHNFIEVCEAVQSALRGEPFQIFPDFPGGGLVDVSGYDDGRGKILTRCRFDTKDEKRIVIRELPFGSTTESLTNSIEAAAKKNKVKIASINDYTAEDVEIEIRLPRGVYTKEVVDALYAFTECENSITVNLLVIKDGKPTTMTITEVIQYHAKRLVAILTQELELERAQLLDRLHARTLERIFVEERIYKRIEEQTTADAVTSEILIGFEPFRKEIRRQITDEDIERLLKIPIRRISRYDIERAKKEIAEINARLAQIKHHLANIVDYAYDYLGAVVDDYRSAYPRRTEIGSFDKVDARDAAVRTMSLRYDANTGYLGHAVSSGKELFKVSAYDRILVIRSKGTYSVIDVPEKLFVGKGMLSCGLADKDVLAKTVFSVVYQDDTTKHPYLKRTRIEQYIIDKGYDIAPDGSTVLALTTREGVVAHVKYRKKKNVRVLEEDFEVDDYLVKGVKALGVRLATREATSARFVARR